MKKQTPDVWIIDDCDSHYEFLSADLKEAVPELRIRRFENALSTFHAAGSPDVIVIDMSAIGSILQPEHCYAPICSLLGKFPGAVVLINSAMGARVIEDIAERVREECPDSVIRCVDWSDYQPTRSIIELLNEFL